MKSSFPRLWLVALAAVATLAASCTNAADGPVSATQPSPSVATSPAPPTTAAPSTLRLLDPVPIDPAVTIGTLDNGLTYYVRENSRPGGRAELRLVVNAGSALEAPDQSGGAHFLEHMLFNGTERFPANELTRVLESFGARFGPDVNAYTSYDETVFELSVATADPEVLELAFDVLLEWAARATIDQAEVEKERGVVLEEWRLRDAGVEGRIAQLYEDVLLRGTGYEGLAPIGDPELLRTTDAAALRRFYEDWYRPGLMAVVAVGDFAASNVVDMITSRFAPLEAMPNAPPRPEIGVATVAWPRFGVLADADQPTASVEIYFPGEAQPAATFGDVRRGWARFLAAEMIATRLNDDITRGDAPYLAVVASEFNYTRELGVSGLVADVASVDIVTATARIAEEVERVRRHGFNGTEFKRAIDTWSAAVDQAHAGRASTQDVEYAGRYVNHFLAGTPIPSAEDSHAMDLEILRTMTVDEVLAAWLELTESAPMITVVIGPDDGLVPDRAVLEGAMTLALAGEIGPRPEQEGIGDSLLAAPEPVEPAEVDFLAFGITELTYSNGVRVQFIQTDISVNQVVMGAKSPGGLSRVADDDVAEGMLVADIVARSGAGGFDRVALDTFLADQLVFVQPYIDVVDEGLFGNAATEDLETLFQLIHLLMVAPRVDTAAVRTALEELRPFAEAPAEIPGLATTLEVIRQRWGAEPRYQIVPTTADLDDFDVARAENVFRERFGDAGDFVFTFAGDFSSTRLRTLADTYLGTLPGTDRADGWIDFQIDPPPHLVDETIMVGDSEQGFVTFLFTNDASRDPQRDIHLELLALVADVKLRDRIREALAATYSPFLSMSFVDRPDSIVESFLQVSGDPAGLDQIVEEALAVLRALATSGPTEAELATAKEQLTRQYELVSNEWWIEQMLFFADRPAESIDSILDSFDFIGAATVDDLRELAAVAFPTDRYVLVRQIPG